MDVINEPFSITSIIDCFSDIDDPRVEGRTLHKLIDIIIISICAIICGANNWKEIEAFGYAKYDWLKNFLELPHDIPSYQTFGRVFSLIPAKHFHECFMTWVNWAKIKTKGEIISIDGKTSRRSHTRNKGQAALHLMNAFAIENGISIAQLKTPDKTNEIKAIPPLLNLLEISGCIITVDAMGTQKGIANLIKLREADYVLSVKGNQGSLHKKVKKLFEEADRQQYMSMVYKDSKTIEGDHGRVEERIYTVLPLMYLFSLKTIWRGLQTFIRVENRTYENGNDKIVTRYFISSLPLKMTGKIIEAIRQHWHIENKLHWRLDVIFREDESRVRRGYAGENLSMLKKIVLNLMTQNKAFNAGIQAQRLYAAWNESYLNQLIGF